MSLTALCAQVCEANVALLKAGLVTLAFGNASGIDREAGVLVIKPSGVPYEQLRPEDMVVVSIADERVIAGDLRPSSDTPTHAVLYRQFPAIGGIVHTHSPFASAWAQAQRSIPPLGTTHADHFAGAVPVSRRMSRSEIDRAYERQTGEVIVETFRELGLDPDDVPAALVAGHGPFTWGPDPASAVSNAIALEAVAALAYRTLALSSTVNEIDDVLLRRHHARKHGPDAYYGQPAKAEQL